MSIVGANAAMSLGLFQNRCKFACGLSCCGEIVADGDVSAYWVCRWLVVLLSLPIEAVVAASDIHATASKRVFVV